MSLGTKDCKIRKRNTKSMKLTKSQVMFLLECQYTLFIFILLKITKYNSLFHTFLY